MSSLAETAQLAGDADRLLRVRADADRGRVLHLLERFDEALAAFDAALQADDAALQAEPRRRLLAELGGAVTLTAYDAARKANPGRLDALRWRGEVLLVLGDKLSGWINSAVVVLRCQGVVQRNYREAAMAFDAYLEKGGARSAAVYRQRALAHLKLGQHEEAIEDYGRALEAKPKDEEKVPLHLYRGQEYLVINELKPALRDFEEALRLDPNSADAALGCAHVHVKQGEFHEGIAEAERAVKGKPKEPRLWLGAARIYAQAGAQLRDEPDPLTSPVVLQLQYLKRAIALLRMALENVPANEKQAYWRDQVMNDTALDPLRTIPEFDALATDYGH